jgi:hypothetical protein
VTRARLAYKVRQGLRESKVIKDRPVYRAQLALRESKVIKAQLESKALLALKGIRVTKDQRVYKDQLDPRDIRDPQAKPDQDPQDPRVRLELAGQALRAPKDLQARAYKDRQGLRATKVWKGIRARRVLLAVGLPVRREERVHPGLQG